MPDQPTNGTSEDTSGGAAPAMRDLTAILVPAGQLDPPSVRRIVVSGGYGDVFLRAKPLAAVGLVQIELFDADGAPRLDANLVARLSERGAAAFVHRNTEAGQAILHAFAGGKEAEPLWHGKPEEIDERARALFGHTVTQIAEADDGTRVHPAFAGSGTMAIVRGRPLGVPVGMPLTLNTFTFHDRNLAQAAQAGQVPDGDRVALLAFDAEAVRSSWQTVAGTDLAERIKALPDHIVGPLSDARDEAVRALEEIGEETPEAAGLASVRAIEMVTLSESYLFGGGETAGYLDERLFPIFTLATPEPTFDDTSEAEELESSESVLAAMVDVLPYRSPEGPVMESFEAGELRPLAPWARPGEEYVGTVFLLHGDRVRDLLTRVEQRDVAGWVDRFYRAWWQAQSDELSSGAEFEAWRDKMDQRGGADVQRFLIDWAEWRTLLQMAHINQLQPALVFYGA